MSAASDRLDEIQQRADAATKGPWGRDEDHAECVVKADVDDAHEDYWIAEAWSPTNPDAVFIAHARQDIPALVGALRAVLDLHRAENSWRDEPICGDCSDEQDAPYPCPTVRAITDALGGEQA